MLPAAPLQQSSTHSGSLWQLSQLRFEPFDANTSRAPKTRANTISSAKTARPRPSSTFFIGRPMERGNRTQQGFPAAVTALKSRLQLFYSRNQQLWKQQITRRINDFRRWECLLRRSGHAVVQRRTLI